MGFYGNVFYQLANSFGKFVINNTGLIKEEFPDKIPIKPNNTTSAIGLDSTYNFDTGNKWIKLTTDNEATMSIYHSPIMDSKNTESIVPIGFINKEEIPEDSEIKTFIAGDYIFAPSFAYDEAGHVIGIKNFNYFRLPIATVEEDIQNLQSTMETVLNNDNEQNSSIEELKTGYNSLTEQTNFIGEKKYFTTLSSSDTITTSLGSINELRNFYRKNTDKVWDGKEQLNISKAILDLDARVKKLNIVGSDQQLTTQESTIIEAVNKMDDLVTTMAKNYQSMTEDINKLKTTIEVLEEKIAILEDSL